MKRFISLLFLTVLFSFSSQSSAESACQAGKGALSSDEIAACVQQEAESGMWLKVAFVNQNKQTIGLALGVIEHIFKQDYSKQALELVEKKDAGARLMQGIEYALNVIAMVFFAIIYAAIILKSLFNGAYKGMVMGWNVFPFSAITFILAIAIATGHFTIFCKILIAVVIFGCFAMAYGVNIFMHLANDVSGVSTRFNAKANEFAQGMVYGAVEWHIQDITARRGMLVETGNVENTNKGVVLRDKEFTKCLLSDAHTPAGKSAPKYYQAADIEKTQYCADKELGYSTYRIGYVKDLKATDESAEVFARFIANQPQYRAVADDIVTNICGSVYRQHQDLINDYNSVCLDLKPNGFILVGNDDIVQTLKGSTVVDPDVMKSKLDALVSDYATFTYTEMLKNANKVDNKFDKSVSLDEIFQNFQIGAEYKKAYEVAGMKTIDIQIINEVAIKKSKLQQALGIEENLDIFGGNGTNETFGLNKYFQSLKPQFNMNSEIIKLLDGIAGNSLSNIGLQYADCFEEKGRCNSGTVNFVTPLIETAHTAIPWMASAYTMALMVKTYYKSKFESAEEHDPNREYYKQNERFYNGFANAALGMMLVLGVAFLFLFKVLILDYANLMIKGITTPILLPFAAGFAFIVSSHNQMFRDDGESFNDLMKKYGVYDVILRLPLVVTGFIIGLCVMTIVMFIASITLATMFGGFAVDNSGAGTLTLALKAMYFVFMYILAYLASFVIGMQVAFKSTEKAINELCGNAVKFDDGVGEILAKTKSVLAK
ncbi:hypothetical protein [Pseudomonas sp. NY8896]|uniref:hypothetical protein n=1 Tax=Pseudomonas sp. NY8896 TaxID=3068639 RepID=UPI0031F681C9